MPRAGVPPRPAACRRSPVEAVLLAAAAGGRGSNAATPAAPPVSAVRRVTRPAAACAASPPACHRPTRGARSPRGPHPGSAAALLVRHLWLPSGRVALAGWDTGPECAQTLQRNATTLLRDGCIAVPLHSAPTDGTRPFVLSPGAIVIAHIWPCQARTHHRAGRPQEEESRPTGSGHAENGASGPCAREGRVLTDPRDGHMFQAESAQL